jgi:hypothetical protein
MLFWQQIDCAVPYEGRERAGPGRTESKDQDLDSLKLG